MTTFRVRCRAATTPPREQWVKSDGQIAEFVSYDAAKLFADQCARLVNRTVRPYQVLYVVVATDGIDLQL